MRRKSDRLLVPEVFLQVEGIENRQTTHCREINVLKNGIDEATAVVLAALAPQQVAHEEVVHWVDILAHDKSIVSLSGCAVNKKWGVMPLLNLEICYLCPEPAPKSHGPIPAGLEQRIKAQKDRGVLTEWLNHE